jgi:hypothetical protein
VNLQAGGGRKTWNVKKKLGMAELRKKEKKEKILANPDLPGLQRTTFSTSHPSRKHYI